MTPSATTRCATAAASGSAAQGAGHGRAGAATSPGADAADSFAALLGDLFAVDAGPGAEAAGPLAAGKRSAGTDDEATARPTAEAGAASDPLAVLPGAAPAAPQADAALRFAAASGASGAGLPAAAGRESAPGAAGPAHAAAGGGAGASSLAQAASGAAVPAAVEGKPATAATGRSAIETDLASALAQGPSAPQPAARPVPDGFAAALAQAAGDRTGEVRSATRGATSALEGLAASAAAAAPAGAAASPEATGVHQAALPSQPLDAAFPGDLAAEVKVMVEGGLQQAELHLNPAELGPIRIQLSVEGGQAEISFAAAHEATREGIEQSLPALRELLAEQGLDLGHAGVSSGQQEGFAQAREQQARAQELQRQRPAGDPQRGEPPGLQGGASVLLRAGRGMLDLYA